MADTQKQNPDGAAPSAPGAETLDSESEALKKARDHTVPEVDADDDMGALGNLHFGDQKSFEWKGADQPTHGKASEFSPALDPTESDAAPDQQGAEPQNADNANDDPGISVNELNVVESTPTHLHTDDLDTNPSQNVSDKTAKEPTAAGTGGVPGIGAQPDADSASSSDTGRNGGAADNPDPDAAPDSDPDNVSDAQQDTDADDATGTDAGPIVDTDDGSNAVSEGAAVGDTVGVVAYADDSDAADTITYALTDDAGGLFAIDPNTGVVTVAGALDAESATTHMIEVMAASSDGSTSVAVFTIIVNDANEFDISGPVDTDASSNAVAENAETGSAVGLTASAADNDATNNAVTYSLVDAVGEPVANGPFAIDPSTGVVTVADAAQIDFEVADSHTVYVRAVSADGSASTQAFTITVNDVNDNGQVFTSETATDAAENIADTDVVYTATATDADTTGEAITYSLTDDAGGLFEIDPNTGEVSLTPGRSLDFETDTAHSITIQSSDGTNTATHTVAITVDDVNDNGQVFTSGVTASAAENITDTDVVYTATTTDADATGEAITYALTDDADGLFEIDADTGEVSLAPGQSLDFETDTAHSITIQSSDGTNTATHTVAITVDDVNDNGQVFTSGATATAAENVADSAVLYTAATTDADTTGEAITYALTDDAGGLFEIDPNTGEVSLAPGQSLDFETDTAHSITIQSSDGTNTTTHTVAITVDDVNDHGQVFTSATTARAAEDVTESAVVYTATTTDADATGEAITYALTDDADGLFEIDPNTGEVSLAPGQSLDFETDTAHSITIQSSDGTNTATHTVAITVDDVNDNGQVFTSGVTASAAENIADTDVVYTATTTDADTTGEAITYSLTDDAGGLFEIDPNTGEVSLAPGQSLDFETDTAHSITIQSSDGTNTATHTVAITVDDVNDNGQVFTSGTTATAAEDVADTDVLYTANATDADTTGEAITYALTDDAGGLFEIDSDTGEVSLAPGQSLDFETDTAHSITIQSSDGTNTATHTVAITVDDVNDNGQVFTSGVTANAAEDVSDSAVLYTATTTDADTTGEAITYALTDDAGGLFEIDPDTGEVSLAPGQSLDFETDTAHSITIQSSDGTNTTTHTVAITVDDVNEAPTDIRVSANAGLDSSLTDGDRVGTASAVDPDAGDTHTFTLTNDANGLFSIDANTGDITVNLSGGPTFVEASGGANPFDGIDIGSEATPTFVDMDNDGDLDMFVGESTGTLNYYENTGDAAAPSFTIGVSPFGTTDVGGDSNPTFVDIDNDGDMDAFVGENSGVMNFFENTGSASNPAFGAAQTGAFGFPDVGYDSAPTFVDIDNDGDMDLFIGESAGDINYYENTGDAANAAFASGVRNPFGFVDIGVDAELTFADLDGDGDLDAISGEDSGSLFYFENTGTSETPSFAAPTSNPFGLSDIGHESSPTFADIDGDGDLDLVVGHGNDDNGGTSGDGVISYFENTTTAINTTTGASYTVTVEATDDGGESYAEDFTFTFGTDGADTFSGGAGSDVIYGFDGADVIDGGAGDDVLVGDSGIAQAAQNLIINGSFENPDTGSWTQVSSIEGWTASSGLIEVGDNAVSAYGVTASDGRQFAEIDAGSSTDSFYQDVLTDAGQSYTLSLDVAARSGVASNTVEVYWNGVLVDAIDPSSTAFESHSFTVEGTGGMDRLEFREPAGENNNVGGLIDNVSLVAAHDDTLNGGEGDDVLIGGAGDDILNGGADADQMFGGDGSDLFVYDMGDGNDVIDGGEGASWTDQIQLSDGATALGEYGVDWTVAVTEGSITSADADSITLSEDADGVITFSDNSTIAFENVEEILF